MQKDIIYSVSVRGNVRGCSLKRKFSYMSKRIWSQENFKLKKKTKANRKESRTQENQNACRRKG